MTIEDRIKSRERITAAAIKYFLKIDPDTPQIVKGANHAQCIEWFGLAELYRPLRVMEKEEQGFLTSTGRFVNRREAYVIASRSGQLVSNCPSYCEGHLYSEYVNY